MAQPQLLQVKLSRSDAQPWGFRLQGGVDFAAPLLVQKIIGGSLAEKAGLMPGDAVIKINDVDVFNVRHKDAQEIVVRSGNNFLMTIQRGGSTWRPHISPTGQLPQHNNSPYIQPVTKTSLAHKQQDWQHIGCGYNNSARPFVESDCTIKGITNKQYNTPVAIYSDESIAETLSAQSEVLAGGVLGVNFKKNEKEYQADKSEVLKFLREEESGHSSPASNAPLYAELSQHNVQNQQSQQSAVRHVNAPLIVPKPSSAALPTGQNICYECERLITGVFVRIKDKNLHVECFKCASCGTSLKNQGYYNFNNKLYCDIHAKLAAKQNPPPGTEGYIPLPIRPTSNLDVPRVSTALNEHGCENAARNGGLSAPVSRGYLRPFGAKPVSPQPAALKSPVSNPPSPISNCSSLLRSTSVPKSLEATDNALLNASAAENTASTSKDYEKNNSNNSSTYDNKNSDSENNGFLGGGAKTGAYGATSAPKRGRGIYNKAVAPGVRVPLCSSCSSHIRGPFISALGRIWCPDHFICINDNCRRPLQDIGFVEEKGDLYCEYCFERYLAPTCNKCGGKIKGDCLNTIGKHFHPECFTCDHCGKPFGNTPFFVEDGNTYCEVDWNELFTTKCFACGFPVEAGDRWVEALNHNYHSQCFNCTYCKLNLEGQSFYNKGGRPFCKNHAR